MVGRNDPCPCGSGKKYKKCCLAKDRAAQAQARQEQKIRSELKVPEAISFQDEGEPLVLFDTDMMARPSPEPEIDPLMERINAFWQTFMDAPYEKQWLLVDEMLAEEPELCDSEMVFEITNTLFAPAIEAEETERFKQLLEQLEETVPDAYAEELHYILEWHILIALREGDDANIEHYFYQFSPLAGEELDTYYRITSVLAYHGKLDILYEGMRQARSFIADGGGLVPWAYDEFTEKLSDIEVLYLLDKNPDLQSEDPVLLQHFAEYGVTIVPDVLANVLDYRSGRTVPSWTLADLEWIKGKNNESAEECFSYLLASFTYYARNKGMDSTKVEMACDGLSRYFGQRHEGELDESEMAYGSGRKRAQKRKGKKKQSRHPLCPDAKTLDRYLAQLMGFMSFQKYEAFALFELIPVWFRFLIQSELLDEETRKGVLQELSYLKGQRIQITENDVTDPAMKENVLDWPYGDDEV